MPAKADEGNLPYEFCFLGLVYKHYAGFPEKACSVDRASGESAARSRPGKQGPASSGKSGKTRKPGIPEAGIKGVSYGCRFVKYAAGTVIRYGQKDSGVGRMGKRITQLGRWISAGKCAKTSKLVIPEAGVIGASYGGRTVK